MLCNFKSSRSQSGYQVRIQKNALDNKSNSMINSIRIEYVISQQKK